MLENVPAVNKAKAHGRDTVPTAAALSFDLFEKIYMDAKHQRRSVSNLIAVILEDHYIAQEQAGTPEQASDVA